MTNKQTNEQVYIICLWTILSDFCRVVFFKRLSRGKCHAMQTISKDERFHYLDIIITLYMYEETVTVYEWWISLI